MIARCLLLSALMCVCVAAAAQDRKLSDDELKKTLDRIEADLGKVKSLSSRFVQEKRMAVFTEVMRAEGLCLFRRPDMLRFEFTQPFQSVLVANAGAVARYESAGGAWRKLKMDNSDAVLMVTGQIASWLQGRFRDKNDLYDLSATESTDGRMTISLTPKNERLREFISVIEIGLSAGNKRVASVTIREPAAPGDETGDVTQLTFSGEVADADLADELFDTARATPAQFEFSANNEVKESR